jgi:Na+(H+)/acetate symporter ActP
MTALRSLWSVDTARALFGPLPSAREIRAASWFALAAIAVLVTLTIAYAARGRTILGHQPCGDYVQFYVAGKILNEYPPARLYDVALQDRLQHAVLPAMEKDRALVYANAPFMAVLFRPLARLPLLWSYGAWMGISLAL